MAEVAPALEWAPCGVTVPLRGVEGAEGAPLMAARLPGWEALRRSCTASHQDRQSPSDTGGSYSELGQMRDEIFMVMTLREGRYPADFLQDHTPTRSGGKRSEA